MPDHVLETAVEHCKLDALRAGNTPAPWSLEREPANFFRRGETRSWTEELDSTTIARIDRMTRKQRAWFGYPDHDGSD